MLYMNEYEVEEAVPRFATVETPNLAKVAFTVENLMHWTNRNSDGWSSWPKPTRAATKAFTLLQAKERDYREDGIVSRAGESGVVEFTDATEAEIKKALAPIKAFLTRQGVAHEQVIAEVQVVEA